MFIQIRGGLGDTTQLTFSVRDNRGKAPRAAVSRAEVPRQNSQLWELILGNYNPTVHRVTAVLTAVIQGDCSTDCRNTG